MKNLELLRRHSHPVIIGGVGGSGTRLIADIIRQLEFFIGYDLNNALDNLWFTLFFKRYDILTASQVEFSEAMDIFVEGMLGKNKFTDSQISYIKKLYSKDREQHSAPWLKKRGKSIINRRKKKGDFFKWGWKEPNSHIVLKNLMEYFPEMKYIHVVRNGLDMAYSKNQNQLKLWGEYFLGNKIAITPFYSLKYWCKVHRRISEFEKKMGTDFLFLNYDKFCSEPDKGLSTLLNFLNEKCNISDYNTLKKLIRPPASIGRFREMGIDVFDESDLVYVNELGFEVE